MGKHGDVRTDSARLGAIGISDYPQGGTGWLPKAYIDSAAESRVSILPVVGQKKEESSKVLRGFLKRAIETHSGGMVVHTGMPEWAMLGGEGLESGPLSEVYRFFAGYESFHNKDSPRQESDMMRMLLGKHPDEPEVPSMLTAQGANTYNMSAFTSGLEALGIVDTQSAPRELHGQIDMLPSPGEVSDIMEHVEGETLREYAVAVTNIAVRLAHPTMPNRVREVADLNGWYASMEETVAAGDQIDEILAKRYMVQFDSRDDQSDHLLDRAP